MAYVVSNAHVTDDITWVQSCCEAVRSVILSTAWLLVYRAYEYQLRCVINSTKSQAVARIADRTASQHLWGSRDVRGHVTIKPIGHFLLVVLWN